MRSLGLASLAAGAALLLAGCGSKPQQAVGVSRGPVVHYLLCTGERVETVRLTTPGGRVLYERRFPSGTTRTAFRVPAVRTAFRVGDRRGEPVMQVERVPARGILRGDGRRVTAAEFAAGRDGYCGSARQDRAAALAVAFAFLVLAAVLAHRWLRSRRSRDPYDRAYR